MPSCRFWADGLIAAGQSISTFNGFTTAFARVNSFDKCSTFAYALISLKRNAYAKKFILDGNKQGVL